MKLADVFLYEPDTGVLRWRIAPKFGNVNAGDEAGTVRVDGRYRTLKKDGKRVYVHRIVWQIMRGPIPPNLCIDHIDGNGLNNRLENLRLVTRSGNQRNKKLAKNNRTGVAGVAHHPAGGFAVTCASKYVGYFQDMPTAIEARKRAEQQHGDFHPNHGRTA